MSKQRAKLSKGTSRLALAKEKGMSGPPTLQKKKGHHLLSLDDLIEDPKNERKTFRDLDSLVATIKSVGILESLTVTPADDGKYMILIGHRRFRAAKKIGLKDVPCYVVAKEEDAKTRVKSIISNVEREEVAPLEMAEALRSLLDDGQYKTQRELAKALGKHEAWVSEMLRILSLSEGAREKLRTSQVPVSYDSAIKVARVKDEKLQEKIASDIASGATVREVRDKAKGKKPSKEPQKKYKKVLVTEKADVIVQFSKKNATKAEVRAALEQAISKL